MIRISTHNHTTDWADWSAGVTIGTNYCPVCLKESLIEDKCRNKICRAPFHLQFIRIIDGNSWFRDVYVFQLKKGKKEGSPIRLRSEQVIAWNPQFTTVDGNIVLS